MQASVQWKGGMSFTGNADSGFTVALGADPKVGGADDGFRPIELTAVSLAGCTAMDVISILNKKRQPVTGFEVQVNATQATEHPHVFTHIRIHYIVRGDGVDPAAVERAMRLSAEKYCPVQAMLGKVAPIELSYEVVAG